MIYFDTNALIALPQWARAGHDVVERVLDAEAAAACAVVWYEYLLGPLKDTEADLAHAFLAGRVEPIDGPMPRSAPSFSMPPADAGH